jgi:hypothetical protein
VATTGPVKKASTVEQKPRAPRAPRTKKERTFDYSRYRIAMHNPADFQAYLQGYPDTTGLMAYVYRLQPKIDFMLIGRSETNIYETRHFNEMTTDFMLSKFGRGRYMLKLNDANRPKGQGEVVRTWFKLDDEEKPAVYDIRTLVLGSPENIDEINRQVAAGVLVRDASGAPRVRTDADGHPVAPLVNGAAGGDLLGRDFIGQVLLKLVTQGVESPADRIKQSIEIAKLLTPPAPPAVAAATIYTPEQMADLVAARLTIANGGASDPFKGWEKIEQFLDKVRGPSAAGPAPAAGGMFSEFGEFLKGAAAALPVIINTVEYMRQRRAQDAVVVPAGANARVMHNGTGAGSPMATLADRIAEVANIGFDRMRAGVSGWDFAAWVCIHHPGGLEVYRFLEPNGVPGVLGLAAMNPQTAPIISDPAQRQQIEVFLESFFDYDPDPSGDAEGDPDPVAAGLPVS